MKFINTQIFRFLFSGGVNTLATYLIYLSLLKYMPYGLSYSLTYVFGIYLSYYLSCRIVFKEKPRWSSAIKYPLVYAVQYILGVAILYFLVRYEYADKFVAPLVVIILTLPVTFILSRWVILHKASPKGV